MRRETHSDAQLYDMWCDGKTAHQIAKEIGSTPKAVNGQLQRHSRLLKEQNFRVVAEAYEPGQADTSDNDKWLETKLKLLALPRHVKVLIESDHHYIDHDPQAIALKNQIAYYYQPDLISLNGDTLDFGAVGHFLLSRSENRKDALKTVQPAYTSDIDTLDDATNGAPKIHNSGNHNARLDTYLDLHLEFAQTIEEYYRHVIRAGGRVMMFDFAEELLIGHLLIQHGQRVGEYAAKNALLDLGMGVSHAQGHGHVANTYYRRIVVPDRVDVYRVATSVMSGCLCRIPPRYARRRHNWQKWTQGIILAHLNPKDRDVHLQNIVFHKLDDGSLAAAVGSEIFIEKPHKDEVF